METYDLICFEEGKGEGGAEKAQRFPVRISPSGKKAPFTYRSKEKEKEMCPFVSNCPQVVIPRPGREERKKKAPFYPVFQSSHNFTEGGKKAMGE